jgi:benzil reductase ((S)-benzoin forming)
VKVFVTGVSKGLGKAFALHFLAKGISVVGIGRSHAFQDPNFQFIACDFSDRSQVEALVIDVIDDEVLFINNAGIIGEIKRSTDQNDSDAFDVMMINSIAPMIFCKKIAQATSFDKKLNIINISSGAGRRSIPSWASYCASKAALDRFSETFYLEEKEKGRQIVVLSIAPGVIDTDMQEYIRQANSSDFSSSKRFHELKNKQELRSPMEVASAILTVLDESKNNPTVICTV